MLLCTTLMLMGVVWLSFHLTPNRIIITPTDDHTIQHDWLHLNESSIIEDATIRPYRWLVEQPKDAFRFLNTRVNHSLIQMSVVLSEQLGHTSFWIIQSTLQNDTPTIITINGASGNITSDLNPTIRQYQWLVPYAFVPQQDHLIPLTNQQFSQYGFTASQPTSSLDDQRIRLARWYGTTYQPIRPIQGYILGGILMLALWIMVWGMYRNSLRWYLILSGTTIALWGMEWIRNGELTLEPIMTLIVSTLSWQLGRWVIPQFSMRMHIPILLSAISFQGVYGYATAYWMQGVDLTEFTDWSAFWAYIAGMRMAMPIPLLTIEYTVKSLGIPGLWSIGYLAILLRIGMIAGVVWALAPWLRGTTRQQLGASIIMVGLLAGTAFVFRYDDRNVWMVYDALFAAPLIWIWRMLQRTTWEPRTLVGIGFVIVWLDALRPFMLPFTPLLVGIVAWHVWRTTGRRGLPYLLAPLIITIGWHAYHIIVLEQVSWSSHTGFNIARAWLPDLAMQTMAQSLPDMNSRAYVALSNMLVSQSIDWIMHNPWLAIQRGFGLLGAMLVIPVEMSRLNDGGIYTIIPRETPWHVYSYRGLMIVGIVMQLMLLMRALLQRRWSIAWWNALFVLAIIGISALTEYGEQARFIAAMAALLWFVDEPRTPSIS
jgi:hypothetical protein